MKMCHIFTLTVDVEKTLCDTLEDIHQQILLTKFHENLTCLWGGGGDSKIESILAADSKIESTPLR